MFISFVRRSFCLYSNIYKSQFALLYPNDRFLINLLCNCSPCFTTLKLLLCSYFFCRMSHLPTWLSTENITCQYRVAYNLFLILLTPGTKFQTDEISFCSSCPVYYMKEFQKYIQTMSNALTTRFSSKSGTYLSNNI